MQVVLQRNEGGNDTTLTPLPQPSTYILDTHTDNMTVASRDDLGLGDYPTTTNSNAAIGMTDTGAGDLDVDGRNGTVDSLTLLTIKQHT